MSNLDNDNFTVNEPLSDVDGRSTDINVWYGILDGTRAPYSPLRCLAVLEDDTTQQRPTPPMDPLLNP